MPKVTDKERVGAWNRRATAGSKDHREWSDLYSVNLLENYFYGHQWEGESAVWDQRKYVINLFYPSVKISIPSMLFQIPKFKVTPKVTRSMDAASDVEARAKLQEDTLNTKIQDPDFGFELETGLGVFDAQFRFGIVEVGYTADFIDNPLAGKPILRDDGNPMLDASDQPVLHPKVNLTAEKAFLKWIPAKDFRVSERNVNRLEA